MYINWPLIIVLFCLAVPGILIAMPRIINFLLADNSEDLKKRISRLAITQALFMTFFMSFAGAMLSAKTGLTTAILEPLLQGAAAITVVQNFILPVLLYTALGLILFFILYYGLTFSILDEQTLTKMTRMRKALKEDGCILYGGVAEEIVARWGLMNLIAFFAILFAGQKSFSIFWISALISGLLYGLSQIPIYIAAGCISSRRFLYMMLILNIFQAILFGWLFWQYGLAAAILSHMLFHFGWYIYDKV